VELEDLPTALATDGRAWVAGGDSGGLQWGSFAAGPTGDAPDAHLGAVTAIAVSADGGALASGAEDRTVVYWRRAAP
jgi:WD40 repeat protein